MFALVIINVFYMCNADNIPYMLINNNDIENDRLIYGDIFHIDDILLPLLEDEDKNSKESDKIELITKNLTEINFGEWNEVLPLDLQGQDIKEFNELINITNNITRRYKGSWKGFYDPENSQKDGLRLETIKKEKLKQIILQFTIHARFYIKRAILKKQPIRMDKRYKIGYLFNRLRRLRYEQLKIVTQAKEEEASQYRTMNAMLRKYEKIVRYDVDIRDTIKWIKALHEEPLQPYHLPEIVVERE